MRQHEQQVAEFFQQARQTDAKRYTEVCQKFPVLTNSKNRRYWRRETTVGLLGLQPANLPIDIAFELGYESQYSREEE